MTVEDWQSQSWNAILFANVFVLLLVLKLSHGQLIGYRLSFVFNVAVERRPPGICHSNCGSVVPQHLSISELCTELQATVTQ